MDLSGQVTPEDLEGWISKEAAELYLPPACPPPPPVVNGGGRGGRSQHRAAAAFEWSELGDGRGDAKWNGAPSPHRLPRLPHLGYWEELNQACEVRELCSNSCSPELWPFKSSWQLSAATVKRHGKGIGERSPPHLTTPHPIAIPAGVLGGARPGP